MIVPTLKAEHEKALAEVRSSVENLTAQLKETRMELEAAQRDVSRLQSEVTSKDTQIKSLQAELANASTSAKTLTSQEVTAIQSALDTARKRITELETQVSNVAQNTQQPVDQGISDNMQARLQSVTAELDAANQKIQEFQSQLVCRVISFWPIVAEIASFQATAQTQSQQTIADLQSKLVSFLPPQFALIIRPNSFPNRAWQKHRVRRCHCAFKN